MTTVTESEQTRNLETTGSSASADWKPLFPFESHYCQIDNQRMHYVDEGAGEPLLMVHGNPTWSFYWRELIRAFSNNYRCLAVDHIGMGWSDKPQNYDYCLQKHIDNLVEFVELHELREVTVIVHDWGGAIGLGAAIRTLDRIKRLVITNTAAFPPPYVPARLKPAQIPLLGTLAVRGLNLFCRAAVRMTTANGLSHQQKSAYLAPYDNWKNRVGVCTFVQDIPLSRRHRSYATLEKLQTELPTLSKLPSLIVWGLQDWCFRPECIDHFLKLLPAAEVERVETAAHYLNEDAPEKVIEAIGGFLRRT